MEIMPVPTCCKLHAHNYTCIPIILGRRGTLDPTGQLVKFDLDLGDGSDTIILLCKTSRWPPVAILYFLHIFLLYRPRMMSDSFQIDVDLILGDCAQPIILVQI